MNGITEFEQLSNTMGNQYKAVNHIIDTARDIMEANTSILESQALTWAITGEKPQSIVDTEQAVNTLYKDFNSLLHNVLCEISDSKIRLCVLRTYKYSKAHNRLIFVYLPNMSDSAQAKIRVISRILWYNQNEY